MDRTRLEEALDLQRRSYNLLLWLAEAVPRGFISFNTAHDYASSSESAKVWIEEHFDNLPSGSRPLTCAEPVLTRFANVFASYLETSFDLAESPGTRLGTRCGCYCPFCAVVVAAPHLRPKRLSPADKRRARNLQRTCVEQLATKAGLSLTTEAIDEMLGDRDTLERAAMVAYAAQLLSRCEGHYTGPYVLALWRTFAWTAKGSPKKEFKLEMDAICDAEDLLNEALRKQSV
jgi:hypothetical protein